MALSTDPTEADWFTPSHASVMLTLALTKILSDEILSGLEEVIQDEAVDYLAAWGHGVTQKDQARVRLLEEDEGGKLFRYITDTLMMTESVVMDIRQIAISAKEDARGPLTRPDMVAIEGIISVESRRRRSEKAGSAEPQGTDPRDESPYC